MAQGFARFRGFLTRRNGWNQILVGVHDGSFRLADWTMVKGEKTAPRGALPVRWGGRRFLVSTFELPTQPIPFLGPPVRDVYSESARGVLWENFDLSMGGVRRK